MRRKRRLFRAPDLAPAVSVAAVLVIWQIIAMRSGSALLPGPVDVLRAAWADVKSGDMARHLGATLARVLVSFVISMIIGSVLGILCGRYPRGDKWLRLWLIGVLNAPALVILMLCYVYLGLSDIALVTAVCLGKIPNVALVVREGAAHLDRGYDDLTRVFRISGVRKLWYVTIPQLMPVLFAAARTGLALVWKIVLVGEFMGASKGVGVALSTAFQLFDVANLLAYSLAFVGCALLVEYAFFAPLERWFNARSAACGSS